MLDRPGGRFRVSSDSFCARLIVFPVTPAASAACFFHTPFVAQTRHRITGVVPSSTRSAVPGKRSGSSTPLRGLFTPEHYQMTFESLGLAPALLRALADNDYNTPTPIQAQAIPLVLSGRDVLGGAQTGTGKTAAFALPVLNRLSKETPPAGPRKPRALVLVPTRELAVQVADSFKTYGRHLKLNVTTLFGGVGMQPQIEQLRRGVDVLVACPGRLIDHLDRGSVKLDAVEVLVLDEADRMLDMGFLPAIKRVLNRVPKQRQTLLFSATFEAQIKALALEFMPTRRTGAGGGAEHHRPDHHPHRASGRRLAQARPADRDPVAAPHRPGAGVRQDQARLQPPGRAAGRGRPPAVAIHGNKSQAARQKALDFKSGKARILVATDVAARGLDIPTCRW
jgi:ATP-dependent RNA helicase RhlE